MKLEPLNREFQLSEGQRRFTFAITMNPPKKRKNRGDFHPTIFKLMATEDKLTAAISTRNACSSRQQVISASPIKSKLAIPTEFSRRRPLPYLLGPTVKKGPSAALIIPILGK